VSEVKITEDSNPRKLELSIQDQISELERKVEDIDVEEGIRILKRKKKLSLVFGFIGSMILPTTLALNTNFFNENINIPYGLEIFVPPFKIRSAFDLFAVCSQFSAVVGFSVYSLSYTFNHLSVRLRDFGKTFVRSLKTAPALFCEADSDKEKLNDLQLLTSCRDPFLRTKHTINYYFNRGRIDDAIRLTRKFVELRRVYKIKPLYTSFIGATGVSLDLMKSRLPWIKNKLESHYLTHIRLALLALESGKTKRSVKHFESALRLKPEEVGLRFIRAYSLDLFDYPEEANEFYGSFFRECILKRQESFVPLREGMEGRIYMFKQRFLSDFFVVKASPKPKLSDEFNIIRLFYNVMGNGNGIARPYKFFSAEQLERLVDLDSKDNYALLSYVGNTDLSSRQEIDLDLRVLNLVSELHEKSIRFLESTNADDLIESYGFNLKKRIVNFGAEFNEKVLARIKDNSIKRSLLEQFKPILFYLNELMGKRQRERRLCLIHRDFSPFNVVYNQDSGIISVIDPKGGCGLREQDTARYLFHETRDDRVRKQIIPHFVNGSLRPFLMCAAFELSRLVGSNFAYIAEGRGNPQENYRRIILHSDSLREIVTDFGSELTLKERDCLLYTAETFRSMTA